MSRTTTRASLWMLPLLAGVLAVGVLIPRAVNAVPHTRDLAFIVAGVLIAGIGFFRPSFAIVASVVAFVFSGFFRRIWPSTNPTADICAIVPFLVALPVAAQGLWRHKPLNVSLLLAWFTLMAARSLGSPLVSVAGWLNVVVPLAAAFGIQRIPRGPAILLRALIAAAAVAATYGIVQYLIPIQWDIKWLADAKLNSAGTFGKSTFRPFATYASPATAAIVSATTMLLLLYKRSPPRVSVFMKAWAFSACTVLVLLCQVRAVWVAVAVTLLVGALTTRKYRLRQIVIPIMAVTAFLFLAPQGQVVLERGRTLTKLADDRSFADRRGLLAQTANLTSVFGRGVGALSAGSRVEGDRSIDNGFLVILGETGVVGLAILGLVLATAAKRSTDEDRPFLILLIIANVGGLYFANIPGLVLWALSGITRPPKVARAAKEGLTTEPPLQTAAVGGQSRSTTDESNAE